MAGLVTEALVRDQEVAQNPSLATERAVKRQAAEKLRPSVAAPATKSTARNSAARASASASGISAGDSNASASADLCQKCGHGLIANERFCGRCGSPRVGDYPAQILPSTTTPTRQHAGARSAAKTPSTQLPMFDESHAIRDESSSESLADSLEQQLPQLFESIDIPTRQTAPIAKSDIEIYAQFNDSALSDDANPIHSTLENERAGESETAALVKPERSAAWSSAASARDFLEKLASTDREGMLARLWNTRRGDVSLAIAVVLVVFVIGWGLLSGHSVQATGNPPASAGSQNKTSSDANLSFIDRTLISLGLAEPPPPAENKGNPDTQVWVDLQTALYYCPVDDLYGKTPKGRMTSQRSAQLDRFEPAYRKMCN